MGRAHRIRMGCGSSAQPLESTNDLAAQGDSAVPDDSALKREHAIGIRKDPIHKDYIFKSQVGKGAFGTVTIAEHRLLKQTRAIKTIPKQLIDKDELQEMITHKEFEMLRSIDHPHVLRVYEMFEDDVACYIVTELMEGGELYDRVVALDFEGISVEKQTREITSQLVSAVSMMHSVNVVHRDIKPENILMVSKDGHPFIKVCDFGFAVKKPEEGMTDTIGTPHYVAPEVLSGENYHLKCDVWSVGVVVYVMLSGRTPFNGDSLAAIAREIRAGRYSFKFPEFEKVSPEGLDFVKTCLQVDPDLRPSMAEMLQHKWLKPDVEKTKCSGKSRCRCGDCKSLKPVHKERVRRFSVGDKLQQGIITFVMTNSEMNEEIEDLGNLFRDLDSNGDGKLTEQELQEGLQQQQLHSNCMLGINGGSHLTEALEVLKLMDLDADSRVDWTEFLSAMVDHTKLLSEEKLTQLFEMIDEDNSNEISVKELMNKLDAAGMSKLNEEAWAEIMQNADVDNNRNLNLSEFLATMKKFCR